jgi:TonB family protein
VRTQAIVLWLACASPALSEEIVGTVLRVAPAAGQLDVKTADRATQLVTADDRTKVTRGGELLSLREIEIGSAIQAIVEPETTRASAIAVTAFFCRLTKVDATVPGEVTVETRDGKALVVAVDGETRLMKVQRSVALGDFQPGQQVWLSLATGHPPRAAEISRAVVGGVPGGKPNDPPAPAPVRVGRNVPEPRKLKDVRPVYPAEARAARIQGAVVIECIINEEGRVSDATILRSVPALDRAALDAVRQWEYAPTVIDGVPVAVNTTVSVAFALR